MPNRKEQPLRNAERVYQWLVEMSKWKQTSRLNISAADIPVKFERVQKVIRLIRPCRMTVHSSLKLLQSQGKITLDYSDKRNPSIIIN